MKTFIVTLILFIVASASAAELKLTWENTETTFDLTRIYYGESRDSMIQTKDVSFPETTVIIDGLDYEKEYYFQAVHVIGVYESDRSNGAFEKARISAPKIIGIE